MHGKEYAYPLYPFDGYWYKLKDDTEDGNPLTIFQLQRNRWSQVCTMSKEDLVSKISSVQKSVISRKEQHKTRPILILESNDKPLKMPVINDVARRKCQNTNCDQTKANDRINS